MMDPVGMIIAIVVMALFGFYIGWIGGKAQGRAESPRQEVTSEMVREAMAHVPYDLVGWARNDFIAQRLSLAMAAPNQICPCCNVTMSGEEAWRNDDK